MRKFKLIALLTTVVLLQFTGCNRNSYATLSPFTPTVLPLTAVYGVMPTRYEISKNTIAVSIEFKGVKFTKKTNEFLDSRRIKLVVHFKNESSSSVVFRKPLSYGFVGPDGSVNDLAILIEM